MFNALKMLGIVAGFGLMLGLTTTTVRAEEKKVTGTVSGTVVDKDGKAVSGATVSLLEPRQKGDQKKPAQQAADDAKPKRPAPVATTTTDDQGKFTLSDVAPGEYLITARVKGGGRAQPQRVTVTADKNTEVSLTLMPQGERPQKKPDATN